MDTSLFRQQLLLITEVHRHFWWGMRGCNMCCSLIVYYSSSFFIDLQYIVPTLLIFLYTMYTINITYMWIQIVWQVLGRLSLCLFWQDCVDWLKIYAKLNLKIQIVHQLANSFAKILTIMQDHFDRLDKVNPNPYFGLLKLWDKRFLEK